MREKESNAEKPNTTIVRSRVVCVMLLTSLTILLTASVLLAQDNAERARQLEAPFLKLGFGKSLIKIPPDRYLIEMEYSSIPRDTQSLLDRGYAVRLKCKASPYVRGKYDSPRNAIVRTFAAFTHEQDDLLELSWVFLGQHLRMISSINAMRLDIDLGEIDRNNVLDQFGMTRHDRTKGLIAAVVRLEGENTYGEHYQIELPWPDTLQDGVAFCSNPDRSIRTLGRWHQRIDAFVNNGVLSILSYKHIPQMTMYRDASKWFDNDFRAWVHQEAREQGKVPKQREATGEK